MQPTYAERATRYAQAVATGELPACELTRLACQRHLNDLERAADPKSGFPYVFDDDSANRVCGFVEMFPHIKGHWARRRSRLQLEDWQCFILASAFGWLDRETGWRRFRQVYIEVPRKNAKTTLSAPVALYMLGPDGEQGAECVVAATKKDQAKIAFDIAKNMAEKSDGYRTEFGVVVRQHRMMCMETNAVFIPIDSRGGTQDGANLHFSLNDELHAWKGRDLYAVLETAMGSRTQPLMWNITTAGSDTSGICYERRTYLVRVLRKAITDEQVFGIIYSIDEGDDIYSESTWRKANPNYGVSVLAADMKALALQAKNNSKSRADFQTKRLNCWLTSASAFFDMEAWDANEDPTLSPDDFRDEECVAALDLASKRDFNSGVRLFERDGNYYVFATHWLPREAVNQSTNASMKGWEADGWLRVTEGNVVDYDFIRETITDDWALMHVLTQVGFDPFQAQHMIRQLQDDGFECVEVRPTVLNFSEPMKELDALMAAGRIKHNGDPVLRWMLSNVVAQKDHKDNVYPRKEREENKIDGAIALISALALKMEGRSADLSIFEQLAKDNAKAAEAKKAAGVTPARDADIDYAALNDIDHPHFAEMAKRWRARQEAMADE